MSLQLSLGKIFGISDGSSGVKCSATEPTTAGKPVGLGNAVTDMAVTSRGGGRSHSAPPTAQAVLIQRLNDVLIDSFAVVRFWVTPRISAVKQDRAYLDELLR